MLLQLNGKTLKYGDNIDTDVIIPARYLNTADKAELSKHAMEDIDSGFAGKVQPGDILAAGENFGCGSSREHAPIVLKYSGISCIIAASFARIFYRNAINIGLPIIECPQAAAEAENGDELTVDLSLGTINNITKGKCYSFQPMPPFIARIMEAGGLMESIMADKK